MGATHCNCNRNAPEKENDKTEPVSMEEKPYKTTSLLQSSKNIKQKAKVEEIGSIPYKFKSILFRYFDRIRTRGEVSDNINSENLGSIFEDLESDTKIYLIDSSSLFLGNLKDNKKNGFGIFITQVALQEGEFLNDIIHGNGRLFLENGSFYSGHFIKGRLNGYAEMQQSDGFSYKGSFRDNSMEGQGEAIYPDQSQYIGMFQKGKRHGLGKHTSVNGRYYDGEWTNDQMQGKGLLKSSFFIYEGDFKVNRFDGSGSFKSPNGDLYEGEFRMGVKNGHGKMIWKEKDKVYLGSWKNGKRHGEGVMFDRSGQVTKQGRWTSGIFISFSKPNSISYSK